MAYTPVQIAIGNRQALRHGAGPYAIGGALYMVIQNLAGGAPGASIEIWQSLDHGYTWAHIDSAGDPTNLSTVAAACSDGVNIYLACADHAAAAMYVYTFNTGSLTWDGGYAGGAGVTPPTSTIGVQFRSSDAKLVIAELDSALSITAGADRCSYTLFDTVAHTFAASVPCGQTSTADPQNWQLVNVVLGAGGLMHLVFTSFNPGGAGSKVQLQTLSAGNALSAIQLVDSTATNTSDATSSLYSATSDGATVVIGFIPNTTLGMTARVYQGASAPLVQFSVQALPVPMIPVTGCGVARGSATTAFFYFVDNGTITQFYAAFDTGNGFQGLINYGGTLDATFNPNSVPNPIGQIMVLSPPRLVVIFHSGVGATLAAFFGVIPTPGEPVITFTFKGLKVYS